MIRLLSLIIIFLFNGCFGPFKKKLKPEPIFETTIIIPPEISAEWSKINVLFSDKSEIKDLLGLPSFVDKHNTGEDWYYNYVRSIDPALISFPVSGHLVNHAQYIRYPEWK